MISENDDDHVIALFKQNNFYSAITKSNTQLLRFRELSYKSLRGLVMTYFDFYFNIFGEKSLRSYSNPVNLSMFDNKNWVTTDEDLEFIGDYLYSIKHHKIIYSKQIKFLSIAEDDIVNSCFSGAIEKGIFKP